MGDACPAICCACSSVPPFDRYAVIPPAHDTVRTALRKVAADASHDDPRSKQIADIAASSPIDYPDPGIAGERAAIEQHCIKADRRRADLEAAQQHQKALDVGGIRRSGPASAAQVLPGPGVPAGE